jgi:hypothetical protein
VWSATVAGGTPKRVDFFVDTQLVGQGKLLRSPAGGKKNAAYALGSSGVLDTTKLTDGPHALRITAYFKGTTTASDQISVTVANATVVPPLASAPPVLSGGTTLASTVTGTTGTWSGTVPITYALQWLRCSASGDGCSAVPGATSTSYTLGLADLGSELRLSVTATNAAGSATSTSDASAPAVAVPPQLVASPEVTGTTAIGQTLSSTAGSWNGTTPIDYVLQWLRCSSTGDACADVPAAVGTSYAVTGADAGSTLRVRVTATNPGGSATAVSAPTPSVSRPSSVYWGALMDGNDTYAYYYGGTWADAPWDTNTWDRFELDAGKKASIIHWGVGSPWTHDFDYHLTVHNRSLARGELELVDMNSGSVALRDVAAGLYDGAIRTWADQAKAWGHPFFLRWDWEMNGGWFAWGTTAGAQNTPADYVAAWRHVHDVFQAEGATNVTWVWCPNVVYSGSVPLADLYPGDEYVDWTGMDGYNQSQTGAWTDFSTLFGSTYAQLQQLAPTKPIMIAETASAEAGGSKAGWIRDGLSVQLPAKFPAVKALVWFNWRINEGSVYREWPIESSAAAQAAFADAIGSTYFAPGGALGGLPMLTKIAPPA